MNKKLYVFFGLLIFALPLLARDMQTIHVMVALCDNKYQGIVKVPKAIGNGQDASNNLYWECGYGIRTYFKKSAEWKEIKRYKVDSIRLERIIFKHKTEAFYMVADAYDGRYIKQCTIDFLNSCAGYNRDSVNVNNETIALGGKAKLLAYIGHNGLMDFSLKNTLKNKDKQQRDAIILACYSKSYFTPFLKSANANPLLWTTHLMAPEAYTLHDALSVYIKKGDNNAVRNSAAAAYSKYQKCGINAAKRLLVTGW